jgi:Ras-related protein Rab-1A
MDRDYDVIYKIILVGDSGVGKSSIVLRYSENTFIDSYISTIGVDFKIITLEIDGKIIKLQIWDTAGQERFRTISTSYYRGAHAIIAVYDVCDEESLKNIENVWIPEIIAHGKPNIKIFIAGNKCDSKAYKAITYDEGKHVAQKHSAEFIEVSAKTNTNIQTLFENIVHILNKNIHTMQINNTNKIINNRNLTQFENKSCCL